MTVSLIPLSGSYRFVEGEPPVPSSCYRFATCWEEDTSGLYLPLMDNAGRWDYYSGPDHGTPRSMLLLDPLFTTPIENWISTALIWEFTVSFPTDRHAESLYDLIVLQYNNIKQYLGAVGEFSNWYEQAEFAGTYVLRGSTNPEAWEEVADSVDGLRLLIHMGANASLEAREFTIRNIRVIASSPTEVPFANCSMQEPDAYDFYTAWMTEVEDIGNLENYLGWSSAEGGCWLSEMAQLSGGGPYEDNSRVLYTTPKADWAIDYTPTKVTLDIEFAEVGSSSDAFFALDLDGYYYAWDNLYNIYPALASAGRMTVELLIADADPSSGDTGAGEGMIRCYFGSSEGSPGLLRQANIYNLQFTPTPGA